MVSGKQWQPPYRVETDSTKWVRAQRGGFLRFHVGPGDVVQKGDELATNTTLTGHEQNVIHAPREGIVLGMTTLPSIAPGDPICHLAFPSKGTLPRIERAVSKLDETSLHLRTKDDLARNVLLEDRDQWSEN